MLDASEDRDILPSTIWRWQYSSLDPVFSFCHNRYTDKPFWISGSRFIRLREYFAISITWFLNAYPLVDIYFNHSSRGIHLFVLILILL